MRVMGIALAVVLGVGTMAMAEGGASRRAMRCCLELGIPEVPGPVCAQVHGRGGIGSRRACRFLGGMPIGRGDCSLAACRPAAGHPGMMGRSS